MVRCAAEWLYGRAKLTAARTPAEVVRAAEVCRRAVKRLRRERALFAHLFADLLDASVRVRVRDHEGAVAHLRAVTSAVNADTRVYAAVAHERLARLIGGAEASAHRVAAHRLAAELGISALDTVADLMAPWPE
jgi:hypothetical protein